MLPRFLLPLLLLSPTAALAEFEFCNTTDTVASVAIGYKGGEGWTSEGWWNVEAGECRSAIKTDLALSHYYYRVESSAQDFDHEAYMFCTSDAEFTIIGDENCDTRGYDREAFNEIATEGMVDITVQIEAVGLRRADPEENIEYPEEEKLTGGAALFEGLLDTSPQVDMAERGTYGEPFTIVGTFSHCDVLDEGINCMFVADDWFYTASSYTGTPMALLEDLFSRDVNQPMMFSGDMASYEGSEAQIVLRDYMVTSRDDFDGDRAAMQGFWTSTEDPKSQVMIIGSLYEEWYDEIPDRPSYMSFRMGCEGSPGDGIAFRLLAFDGMEDRCFFVSYVDETQMELIYAGGIGDGSLSFRKDD